MTQKFLSYDPYSTFSNSINTCLIDHGGEEISDTESLFNLGMEAYKNIGEFQSKEIFDEIIAAYQEIIDEWRQIFQQKNIRCISPSGKEFKLDWSKAEDCQIVNVGWKITSDKRLQTRYQKLPEKDLKTFHAELYLLLVFIEIDNANMNTILDPVAAVGSAIDAANALANAMAIISEDEKLQEIRKNFAYRGAMAKVENDPKQKDKKFVYECWQDWQEKPTRYQSKAAFARDMLDKCEHLVSNKKIEDWCREWEKSDTNKLNPAS
jgi:hypothetical protein